MTPGEHGGPGSHRIVDEFADPRELLLTGQRAHLFRVVEGRTHPDLRSDRSKALTELLIATRGAAVVDDIDPPDRQTQLPG